MRILIFILALMSAFFVPKSFSIELDLSSLVPPKSKSTFLYDCVLNGKHMLGVEASITACFENSQDAIKGLYPSSGSGDSGQCQTSLTPLSSGDGYVEIKITYQIEKPYGDSKICGNHTILGTLRTANPQETVNQTCPPDGHPDHKYEYKENPENESIMCAKLAPDCPAGYHSKGTSRALGSQSCVPKDCPPTGSSESLFSSPTIGGVPFDGGGLYCNDGCAYNVNESQISLGKYAIGVSQGIACGDKPYDNKKLADDANADQCTTATDGTVSVLQCPDYNQPEPETDPINNDASKVDDSETPLKEKESCAEGDTTCNLKNVETEIENSITRQIDNDNELHNKKIEADEKNAKAFLNVMDSIDTAILMQTAQDDRFHAVTVGKFNELIDAVNGIETGGGGGGGNGTGNGNIGGQDCEGTIEECAGIGSGDGVELPQETMNLEQYAQKYNNWLPNAELPPEKCITLTNGKTLCFSFEYFILFFQAISGLIVISSLIHSASIIVRSV